LFVHPGCKDDDISKCAFATKLRMSSRIPGTAVARPGYFALNLTNGVRAEMAATAHASLFRFSLPDSDEVRYATSDVVVPASPVLLLDVQDLAGSRREGTVRVSLSEKKGSLMAMT
jgi:hypothetical protein